jgi:membrane-associated phospholipid phosphatase
MGVIASRVRVWGLAAAVVGSLAVRPIDAQALLASVDAEAAAVAQAAEAQSTSAARRFAVDVLGDYKNFFSVETALWLGGGGVAALAVHPADEAIRDAAIKPGAISLPGGSVYGSQYFQIPVAITWWAVGSRAGSDRHAETGRDLLRAQLSVSSWTYLIKLAADRTRPNGDPHSFPSGHATASFAAATVLQEHYGWKVGLPAFLVAAYTGASRVADNEHWTSDVVFGAALGVASGRTVTIHCRQTKLAVAAVAVHRGAALNFTLLE